MAGGGTTSNAFQQASSGFRSAGQAAQAATQFRPQNVAAQTAAGEIPTYMNPYAQQVVDRTQQDVERQRQMAMNDIGAQATAANAFGGSRHGVAESLTNEAFARQSASQAAQLRAQGFQTALGAAQQDVANTLSADLSNQQAAQNAAQLRLQGAGQLAGIADRGFGRAMDVTQQQLAQGVMLQGMNQAIIDAARGQWQGYANAPAESLQYPLAAISSVPHGQSTTQKTSQQPGLFNYLSLGLGLL